MSILSHTNRNNSRSLGFIGAVLLFLSTTSTFPLHADIVIKGDIYGGGREGAVGTANTTTSVDAAKGIVVITNASLNATDIEINAGQVRTVFGGGQEGRTFGSTSVKVNDGTIGGTDWNGTIHGGLFGAGDGNGALVFGGSNVEINGGTIVQNVYGGGNEAELIGTTNVNLKGGNIQATVYGGARVANIYGYSLVNINGAQATDDLIIGAVYGGNDIAGNITIPTGTNWSWIRGNNLTLPTLSNNGYGIDKSWNAFVFSSHSASHKVYVAQVYGGGNGEYTYTGDPGDETMSELNDRVWNSSESDWDVSPHAFSGLVSRPEVSKVYLELKGGNFGYVYGGGNNATVTSETVICLNNTTEDHYTLNADRMKGMGINLDVDKAAYTISGTGSSATSTPKFQFDRVFGGNKNAEMKIQPTWHLERAEINSLYSGGDAGDMTYGDGLFLELTSGNLTAKNVYGGCRRANVTPKENGVAITPRALPYTVNGTNYNFPEGYSAHILVTAGTITNVYGGNDISGTVTGGNAIDIRSDINGNVYGGGNGSYVYTDKPSLANDPTYGDFYYTVDYGTVTDDAAKQALSVAALNAIRPSAQKSFIRISGTDENTVTEVNTVYGGGNSATITESIKLQLGEYVNLGNVFLGSNGEEMVTKETLQKYYGTEISSLDFTNAGIFDSYMMGAAVAIMPDINIFQGTYPDKLPDNYNADTDTRFAHIGSFFCGGNVASMTSDRMFDVNFLKPVIIRKKVVGGCNNAFVDVIKGDNDVALNTEHHGGFTTATTGGGDKIHLTIKGVQFVSSSATNELGDQGNIFGGCFNSGIVNGNVVIDLKQSIIPANYTTLSTTESMTTFLQEPTNLFKTEFSVFGGGFGEKASVTGMATVNISSDENMSGRALKVFGGGLKGTVANTTINITGGEVGKIYGGGFEGLVTGNTTVNLDGGTIYDSFGGACNADIEGYAQTFVGHANTSGITTVLNSVFGGNDFGGTIESVTDLSAHISGQSLVHENKSMVYNPSGADVPNVLKASAYVEFNKGIITNYLFGGSCGYYDYSNDAYSGHTKTDPLPHITNAFVNFKPVNNPSSTVQKIFGAGQGYPGTSDADNIQDKMQDRSYVLIDIPDGMSNFGQTDVFGAGAYSGVGMKNYVAPTRFDSDNATAIAAADNASAIVDLMSGNIQAAYGSSFNEGVTRRSVVNVPAGSTIVSQNIFGGGYGSDNEKPCDTYESIVNFSSEDARARWIYGGNNDKRRTLYSFVNINSEVWWDKSTRWLGTVYGAGCGKDTWSEYTEVNLNDGTLLYEVYGGGYGGRVLDQKSLAKWITTKAAETDPETIYNVIGGGYDNNDALKGLNNPLVKVNGLGDRTNTNVYINSGATIGDRKDNRPATVNVQIAGGYCYGGGYGIGHEVVKGSGVYVVDDDEGGIVSGTTYVGLHGGTVWKDIYAGGTLGGIKDYYESGTTVVSNAFIEGGTVRNVYGGGWEGDVGLAVFDSTETVASAVVKKNIPATSNVVIGILDDEAKARGITLTHEKGIPTVMRNAYSGGEGGAIFGTAKLTINNGYIGYTYDSSKSDVTGTDIDERYVENLDDETWNGDGKGRLEKSGNAFGGGYVDDSSVDITEVRMYGGWVRNSLYGGGEIATIGRGDYKNDTVRIFMPGTTNVYLYGGHVLRDVFGGGRGFNNVNDIGQRNTNGFIMGKTNVYIHGGEVGTAQGTSLGYGNVFGGGNIGFVYSDDGVKAAADNDDNNITAGYYYDSNNKLTEDCKVVVAPACKVIGNAVTFGDGNDAHSWKPASLVDGKFTPAQYVPIADLNTIELKSDDRWKQLDTISGVKIHNAVFAGGNITRGSDLLYAEAVTVFGNATASLIDVFCMDLITIGEDEIGGLYGDGNLTFVDGYRELNITNYGTDYYDLKAKISTEEYFKLNDRQRAYFELRYINKTDGSQISEDYYNELSTEEKANYELMGVCSIYAGRMLNTIQRADFCGLFGSRLVLKGARDRVPEKVDYTNYTINRVGEVSLNKSEIGGSLHGNYFGIYNIVNYLGALTSDVKFTDTRKYKDGEDIKNDDDGNSYKAYKEGKEGKRDRNKAYSHNEVALASGVFLELTRELSKNYIGDEKEYGPITGIIGLELIAASVGEGGGYVYAKNIHGTQTPSGKTQLTLTAANTGAVTQKSYDYTSTTTTWMESSGNFVTSGKDVSIIDDCFPVVNSYHPDGGEGVSEAHFWYIRGYYYVYNQEISAYTGSMQAYTQNINIPLTISAQGNGKLIIEDIKTNKYANAAVFPDEDNDGNRDDHVICNGITYHANDPISFWDWNNLSVEDKRFFVDTSYVCVKDALVGTVQYSEGQILLKDAYNAIKTDSVMAKAEDNKYEKVAFDEVFHLTNGLSHTSGYALSVALDNPKEWSEYFTNQEDRTVKNQTGGSGYLLGPTYMLKTDNTAQSYVFGQREYVESNIIEEAIVTNYNTHLKSTIDNSTTVTYPQQAEFQKAYIYIGDQDSYSFSVGSGADENTVTVVKRGAVPANYYTSIPAADKDMFVEAYICTQTIKVNEHLILSSGRLFTRPELIDYAKADAIPFTGDPVNDPDDVIFTNFAKAYYCTTSGAYGGSLYQPGHSYQAVQWAGLNKAERDKFEFNYDALDVLIDPTYSGNGTEPADIRKYDLAGTELYSATKYVDYDVIYTGPTDEGQTYKTLTKTDGNTMQVTPNGPKIDRETFETLANERKHYAPVSANFQEGEDQVTVYVVKSEFGKQGRIYTVGTTIAASELDRLFSNPTERNQHIESITLTRPAGGDDAQKFYYCFKSYTPTTTINTINGKSLGAVGSLISADDYETLINEQVNFKVVAEVPREKSSLYVSRDCNINDFTQDRILTVIYRYSFAETDDDGNTIENVAERHVLNIRVHFESGIPMISDIQEPPIILPGTILSMEPPTVVDGAFDVIGGAWEVYHNQDDALAHRNGMPYAIGTSPMYWYQDEWYVAYYAETYLGRTYSNAVPIAVANYHDIDKVMADNRHHLYIDHKDVKRNSKIYIDNGATTSEGDNTKSKLDLLYDLYNLSLQPLGKKPLIDSETGETIYDDNHYPVMVDDPDIAYNGLNAPSGGVNNAHGQLKKEHAALNSRVKGLRNLEFILNSDVQTNKYTEWTPIGDTEASCFGGNIHGNGYTVSGIDHSLFGYLCGNVFNLGVRGEIAGSGLAENGGYAENIWVINDASTDLSGYKPVMGTGITVNAYYNDDAAQTAGRYDTEESNAIYKPLSAFLNGEVAYNLNGFYLKKRWSDEEYTADGEGITKYSYLANGTNNSLSKQTGYYKDSEWNVNNKNYVENYYADGDYIYSNGDVNASMDSRYQTATKEYLPIWPDDYIFFGQKLTYASATHAGQPARISGSNRVYRAPGYYGSKVADKVYFNKDARFAAQYDGTEIHKELTAIDLTGYGNTDKKDNGVAVNTYTDGSLQSSFFYPVLDYDGLSSYTSDGITQNLLVYIESDDEAASLLNNYFQDKSFTFVNPEGKSYNRVNVANYSEVKGHLVKKDGTGKYVTDSDHYLVDKQNFNAPISYQFIDFADVPSHMWYQRTPDTYVNDLEKGWESISLPFTAEYVTTQFKGELTHFYQGSKVGHEYWLRKYDVADTQNSKLIFKTPAAEANSSKTVGNTFLWDYYYSVDSRKDKNSDEYQQYYNTEREYTNYPYYEAGTPYLIGFPGSRYYEFDLSGSWLPSNSLGATEIARIAKQTITFISGKEQVIQVTDDEYEAKKMSDGNYTYMPTYQAKTLAGATTYLLNQAGSAFQNNDADNSTLTTVPFRAYFTSAGSHAQKRAGTRADALYIGYAGDDDQLTEIPVNRGLIIYGEQMNIVVESTLEYAATVTVTSVAGKVLKQFTIQPGTKVTVPVQNRGVYIVNRHKIAVTK